MVFSRIGSRWGVTHDMTHTTEITTSTRSIQISRSQKSQCKNIHKSNEGKYLLFNEKNEKFTKYVMLELTIYLQKIIPHIS